MSPQDFELEAARLSARAQERLACRDVRGYAAYELRAQRLRRQAEDVKRGRRA